MDPGSPEGRRAAPPWRGPAGLLAGLLLLDILVNVPAFSPAAPIRSLVAPSIDLLVLVALCMGMARADAVTQRVLRIGVAVLAVAVLACAAGLRFGWDAGGGLFRAGMPLGSAASWAVLALLAVAAGLAAFALSGVIVKGLQPPLFRGALLLAVSLAALLQVIAGRRVFTGSIVTKLVALIR